MQILQHIILWFFYSQVNVMNQNEELLIIIPEYKGDTERPVACFKENK